MLCYYIQLYVYKSARKTTRNQYTLEIAFLSFSCGINSENVTINLIRELSKFLNVIIFTDTSGCVSLVGTIAIGNQ